MAAWLSHSDTGYKVDEYKTLLFRIYRKLALRLGVKTKSTISLRKYKNYFLLIFSLICITLLGIRVYNI